MHSIAIANTFRYIQLNKENLPERIVLTAVDDDVDAGVEDQQDVGDDGHHLTPCRPGGDLHCPFHCQMENLIKTFKDDKSIISQL